MLLSDRRSIHGQWAKTSDMHKHGTHNLKFGLKTLNSIPTIAPYYFDEEKHPSVVSDLTA